MLWSEFLYSWVFFCAILSFELLSILYCIIVDSDPKKKVFKFLLCPAKKKYKIDHISKTKNCTKNVIYAKNERQINPNLPYKFGYFWRKMNFWTPKTPLYDPHNAQARYDVIWNFQHIFSFSTLRIFYVKMATSEREGGSACPCLGQGLYQLFISKSNNIWIMVINGN